MENPGKGEATPSKTAGGAQPPSNAAVEWVKSMAIAAVLFVVLRSFLVQTFVITSGSMEDTLLVGDMLMVNLSEEGKIAVQTHEIDDYDQTIESVYPPEQTEKYLRDLNRLRREHAREFLVLGRMERPPAISCAIASILEGEDLHPWMPTGSSRRLLRATSTSWCRL